MQGVEAYLNSLKNVSTMEIAGPNINSGDTKKEYLFVINVSAPGFDGVVKHGGPRQSAIEAYEEAKKKSAGTLKISRI
jgi:hypothetical protein